MTVKIRLIVLKDAASYRQCWDVVAKERRHIPWYKAPPLSEVRTNLRRSLRKKTPFLVAVDGERVVGWAAVFSPSWPTLSHNGDLLLLLLPEYRGKGLGTKLASGVLKMAQDRFDSVLFGCFSKNKPARKLGRKMGFELCAREKKFCKLAYGFDDRLVMQKEMRR